jgi:hypothetical protein
MIHRLTSLVLLLTFTTGSLPAELFAAFFKTQQMEKEGGLR